MSKIRKQSKKIMAQKGKAMIVRAAVAGSVTGAAMAGPVGAMAVGAGAALVAVKKSRKKTRESSTKKENDFSGYHTQ